VPSAVSYITPNENIEDNLWNSFLPVTVQLLETVVSSTEATTASQTESTSQPLTTGKSQLKHISTKTATSFLSSQI